MSNSSDVLSVPGLTATELAELSQACLDAKLSAYCPYSHFAVGASILLKPESKPKRKLIVGANIENAAYPVGTCAERVAIGTAVIEGAKYGDIMAVGVAANTDDFCSPCGMCRQFLKEFCPVRDSCLSKACNKC